MRDIKKEHEDFIKQLDYILIAVPLVSFVGISALLICLIFKGIFV